MLLTLPAVMFLGGHGANSWCSSEGFDRASGFHQRLSLSAWPPGVRCSLELVDGADEVQVLWPIDW